MCRIVINQSQVAETASALQQSAGEYQAIGARVATCDCGCMPADVAALVDTVTALVRTALQGIAIELTAQASELGRRAGIDQSGGQTAISAAWGSGSSSPTSTVTVGGFGGSLYGESTGGATLIIGGTDTSMFATPVGTSTITIGGFGGHYFDGQPSGTGTPITIGGFGGHYFDGQGSGTAVLVGGTNLDFGSTTGGTWVTLAGPSFDYDPSAPLPPTGDLFWDNPEAWLEQQRPASIALANSGFMPNFGPTLADIGTAMGNIGLNAATWGSGGTYQYNYAEHANFFVRPGELYGTRV